MIFTFLEDLSRSASTLQILQVGGGEITINVSVVYMAGNIIILRGVNPFQGPLEGGGP
jgi:hypothetical protein